MNAWAIQRRTTSTVAILLFGAAILVGPIHGATLRVPQDHATIQAAIDAAGNGDDIIVSPGTYPESIRFKGKNIVLRSTAPTNASVVAATILTARPATWVDPVVSFAGTEASSCVLEGFTITKGAAALGAGISGSGTHATIRTNRIVGNHGAPPWRPSGAVLGGGLFDCDGLIRDNVISDNSASTLAIGMGGGLYGCDGIIENNLISGNWATGYFVGPGFGGGLAWCNGAILQNVIRENYADFGGGLGMCQATMENNLITSNSASQDGGLSACAGTIRNCTIAANASDLGPAALGYCTGTIVNCIVWGNRAGDGTQIGNSSAPIYSCIEGFTSGGVGNIGSNPRFRGPDDFHLRRGSPCIDAGANAYCPANDLDGAARPLDGDGDGRAICDMGAYEFPTLPAWAGSGRWWLYD